MKIWPLAGIFLLAVPAVGHAQNPTQCYTLSQTQILGSLADYVGARSLTPQTFRNLVCSTGNYLVTPSDGGTADTLANWTAYLAGTIPSPFSFTAANLLTPGAVVAGSPTGGNKGAGTINATGVFVNGVPIAGGLTVPNSPLIGGNGSTLTSVAVGSGLALAGGSLSVSGAMSPQSIVVGAPTGGNLGTGTVNATGLFVNGVAVSGGLSVPNSNLLGGNGSALLAVSAGAGLTFTPGSPGVLSVTSPYNPTLVGITGGSINGTMIGNSSPATGAFTTLAATGTVSGTGFLNYLASPPSIGSGTPNSGAFTTISTTGIASPNSVVVGSPTGGNEGAGTINSTGVYVNGVPVAGGLSVPNASVIGGNGSSLTAVTVGSGLSFSGGTLSVSVPYGPSSVTITGGSINGTTLGAATPSTGAFTTLSSTGQLSPASVVVGSATGGNEGAGTINTTGVYVNGVAVAGGLTVPNASLIGGNGSSLLAVTVGSGLSFGTGTLSVTNTFNPTAVAITGGTINGTTIGGSTPAPGTFSTLTSNGSTTLSTTVMTGKLTGFANASVAPFNITIGSGAPATLATGDLWATSAGLFLREASTTIGPFGTVSSVATSAPLSGGTITGTGTVSCPTCVTSASGGAISGLAPITISNAAIGLGNTTGEGGVSWNSTTVVTADSYPISVGWGPVSGSIVSVKAVTGGTSTPSFTYSIQVNGTNVPGCSGITVSTTPTTTTCTVGTNLINQGNTVNIVTAGISGTPTSAYVHLYYTKSNP